ncbi:hydroxyacylglutathione hydrolase [Shewanella sp. A25]|nr:hydroxyacylglutathione hydrolase [Shewanella shenzhenensis]
MLTITAVNAFNDNYIWVLQQDTQSHVYVVDPGDADVVINYLASNQLQLAGILITHHHRDHTGGIAKLSEYTRDTTGETLKVYGPKHENIAGVDQPIDPNLIDELNIPYIDAKVKILSVPGHTAGHIAYVIEDNLFCGDTLFSAGCGRLFEGTSAQMHHSLSQLTQLPSQTKVYCAHEYTLSNLKFALRVDPQNPQLRHYMDKVTELRAKGIATIPSTIGLELAINPFLRANDPHIQHSIKQHFCDQNLIHFDTLSCFSLLRQWKDIF